MNLEIKLTPNAALRAASENIEKCQTKLDAFGESRGKQQAVVKRIFKLLTELVTAQKWESAPTPEDAKDAKHECTELIELLEDERSLMNSINATYSNAWHNLAAAKHKFAETANAMIREAAVRKEPEVKENLVSAMTDFFACHLAQDGIQSIGGAQYELEMLAQDHALVRGVETQVNSIHQSLRESVTA